MAKLRAFEPLPDLEAEQATASRPDGQIWLSASAGAGKTQVLTARVLRLLLNDADPDSILCLTFTKAGAAEMADRIHDRLGAWVTLPEKMLRKELSALGEPHLGDRLTVARQLFAKVLDARGGGLRIQTIHSFAQTVLAAFPAEAGLPVGFRPIEGREELQLRQQALGALVTMAEKQGRLGTIDRLKLLARRIGEAATRRLLDRCAQVPDAMELLGTGDMDAVARRLLSGGIDDIQGWLEARCSDALCDIERLTFVRDANMAWTTTQGETTVQGRNSAAVVRNWLLQDAVHRVATLEDLRTAWMTQKGTFRTKTPDAPGYATAVEALDRWLLDVLDKKRALALAPAVSAALELGQDYARIYGETKRAAGVVDFNDLIRATLRVLKTDGIGDWIRYKLDQSIDHILVDEAQDTNADQWDIVKALSGEFFVGEGAKADRLRTIFAVGDFKQAIFGFQGTNPEKFEEAGADFRQWVDAAGQDFETPSINKSFRSSQPILDVVDAVLTDLGEDNLGLPHPLQRHVSAQKHGGYVEVMPAVAAVEGDEDSDAVEDEEETWLAPAELILAERLAKQVRDWTTGGLFLDKEGRLAEPGDVMILLRSRNELARLIVSRLYEEKVPVAGVDRLQLHAPIAVQDLMACIRFVLQPGDDLALASILVSPLMGWSQDDLYARAFGRKTALWPHLRATCAEDDLAVLRQLLDMADRTTPYAFLEAILSGPIGGRRKILTRLGEEARDPIEELLNAALQFEAAHTPSLQLFLDWFSSGNVDIKRDSSKRENAVRVMTVHGAKGLQAPIVILADATADPKFRLKPDIELQAYNDHSVPLFRPKKEDMVDALRPGAEAQDKKEQQEHWRLLYVAMTRAEERLYICGAKKPSQMKNGIGENCWHRRIEDSMAQMADVVRTEDGALILHRPGARAKTPRAGADVAQWPGDIPPWTRQSAPEEARPARPLSPSSLGVPDMASSPPPDPAMRAAAQRGTWLHALFERLPAVAPEARRQVGLSWLESQQAPEPEALITAALAVISDPDLAHVFAPDALAEAPLAGVVDGQVIAGIVDRLLVTPEAITVVDFKTGRHVPSHAGAVPNYYKAQMGAYAAVLQGIFPGRQVRAVLLYTAGPSLIELPADMLAAWRPGHSPP